MDVWSTEEPERVDWRRRADGQADVRLRRYIRRVESQDGTYQWRAEEQYLVTSLTEEQCSESFDELWEQAASEAKPARQLVEELSGSLAGAFGVAASKLPVVARAMSATFRAMPASDEQAVEFAELYPKWEPGKSYEAGTVLRHDGGLYRVAQAHSSQAQWVPGEAGTESLYTPITLDASGVEEWRRPAGAHDAYPLGKVVRDPDDGLTYRSTYDGANVWGPPHSAPDYWARVAE